MIDRDGGDVLAFETVQAAAGFMEPPEVKDDAYLVFDADAYEATPVIQRWDVKLESWSADTRETKLQTLLVAFLSNHAVDLGSDASFGHVVSEAAEVARRLERESIRPRFVSRWQRRQS